MAKKILIVDDDKDLVASLEQVLLASGYEVASAANGAEGLKALEAEKPDLVILDVMMETDTAGFEVADRIRSRRATSKYLPFKDIPIIILTAINQVTNSRFSMDQGDSFLPSVYDLLTKPVDIDELLGKVAKCLG